MDANGVWPSCLDKTIWQQITTTVKPSLWKPSGLRRHLWWQSHVLPGWWTRAGSHCTRPSAGYPCLEILRPLFRLGWSSKLKKHQASPWPKHHPNTFQPGWIPSQNHHFVLFSGTLSIPLWCRRETQQPPIIFKNCFVQNNHPAVTNPFSKHPSKKNEKLPAKTSPTLVTSTPP